MSMTSRRFSFFLALLIVGSLVSACDKASGDRSGMGTHAASSQQIRSEVQEAVKAYASALNRADVAGVLELYSREPGLTSIGDGKITRGWESVRAELDSLLTGLQGNFSASLGSIDVTSLGSGHALAVAPYTLTVGTPQGPRQIRGAMSFVLQQADAGWKIIHEHSSTLPVAAP